MMQADKLLAARIQELSERCFQRDIPQHTEFLDAAGQAVFHELKRSLSGARYLLYGGYPEADRRVLLFLPSYLELPEPVAASGQEQREQEEDAMLPALFAEVLACIRISPLNEKFSDELTHRDYLGALMNLGIERDKTGDILKEGASAYLFCMADIADFICEELHRVRHTSVSCERISPEACRVRPAFEELSVNVASQRLDAVIAAVYKLSRGTAAELIAGDRVFLDGRSAAKTGEALREHTRVSVRGYGKFLYEGTAGETRKGRLYVRIRKFL